MSSERKKEWENASEESMGPCNRVKWRVCTKEEEDISIVEGRERRGAWVY